MDIQKLSTPAIFYLTVAFTTNLITLFIAPYQCHLSFYSCILLLLTSIGLTLFMVFVVTWVIDTLALSSRFILSWVFSLLFVVLNLTDLYYLNLQNRQQRLQDSTPEPTSTTPQAVFIENDGTVTPIAISTTTLMSVEQPVSDEQESEEEVVPSGPLFREIDAQPAMDMKPYEYPSYSEQDMAMGSSGADVGGVYSGAGSGVGGGDRSYDAGTDGAAVGGGVMGEERGDKVSQDMSVGGVGNVMSNIEIAVVDVDTNQQNQQSIQDNRGYDRDTVSQESPLFTSTLPMKLFGTTLPGTMVQESTEMPSMYQMDTTLPSTPLSSLLYGTSLTPVSSQIMEEEPQFTTPYQSTTLPSSDFGETTPYADITTPYADITTPYSVEEETTPYNNSDVTPITIYEDTEINNTVPDVTSVTRYNRNKDVTLSNDVTIYGGMFESEGLPSRAPRGNVVTAYSKKNSGTLYDSTTSFPNTDTGVIKKNERKKENNKSPFSTMNSSNQGNYATFNRPETEKDYGFSGFSKYLSSSKYSFV